MRLSAFYEQPVPAVFEPLYKDVMVFTEYLWKDLFRTRLFMRRLYTGEADQVRPCPEHHVRRGVDSGQDNPFRFVEAASV